MKHLKTNISILALFFFSTLLFTACDDDKVIEPPKPNEEELITSVELSFTNKADSDEVLTFRFADPDGEGGEAPTEQDVIQLAANSEYTMAIRFLDESDADDVEDITLEVKEEDDEHLVCYTPTTSLAISITDTDANGLELGLEADAVTTDAGEGVLVVVLKHQPDVKDGNCDVGETDVEVSFTLEIK